MTQADLIARQEALRARIAKLEAEIETLRAEESRLLGSCGHQYADGRPALTGGTMKVCAVCGHVPKRTDEKLWG